MVGRAGRLAGQTRSDIDGTFRRRILGTGSAGGPAALLKAPA
jgi:hypothetical protein